MDKTALRSKMKAIRTAITVAERAAWSKRASQHLWESAIWREAQTIGLYASFRGELDTRALMQRAVDEGKRVALPKVGPQSAPLSFWEVTKTGQIWSLCSGAFGVQEPDAGCVEVGVATIDLLLVPALAISPRGDRLGWGGGYYDRTVSLPHEATVLALIFECQRVVNVPHLRSDQRVGGWVSEAGLVWV